MIDIEKRNNEIIIAIQSFLQVLEEVFEKTWSKQKFKFFFKKHRQEKIRNEIFSHYGNIMFLGLQKEIESRNAEDIYPLFEQIADLNNLQKWINVKKFLN